LKKKILLNDKKTKTMKKVFLLLVMLANAVSGLFAQTDFFYSENGKEEHFKIRKDKIAIRTKSKVKAEELLLQESFRHMKKMQNDLLFATVDSGVVKTDKLEQLEQREEISDVHYFLEYADGALQLPTERIFVKPKHGQSLKRIIQESGLSGKVKTSKEINSIDGIHMLTLDVKMKNILQVCRIVYKTGLVDFVEPCFTRQIRPFNQYYQNQWGLKNTGQNGGTSGIDIKAEATWSITRGNSNIKVAVLDEGVDLTHPDLQANLLTGYDATSGSPGGANGSPWANNAHGTACAGIIGAINNTIGIAGVASGCKIIPVRIAYDYYDDGYWTTDDEWIIAGFQYARNAGADVISNSWGGGPSSATITAEISDAVTQGRNGKGCVVVFASGNNNASSVSYPASLSNVIAVGAISQCGQRKSPTSCDGETDWGSNYGTNLDVVAPGVDIYTTDIQGSAGYNNSSGTAGNYYASFGGTSAACPHVAGIAALILSVRTDLTQAQVRQAIESTCTKLSGYSYSTNSNHPNGTWNEEVGHGLVNAYQAVYSVAPRIDGVSSLATFIETIYSISNLPSNTTVTWSGTNNIHFESAQTGQSVMIYASSSSPATLTATLTGAINKVLTKNISVYNGSISVEYNGEYAVVTFNISPYAYNVEWNIPGFTTQIGTGSINSGSSITLTPVADNNSGGYISVRAHINDYGFDYTTQWYEAYIHAWRPVIDVSNSDLNPTFCQNGTTVSRINLVNSYPYEYLPTYVWYIDNSTLDATTQPYIDLYISGCLSGTHNISVKVMPTGDVICPKSQSRSFSGYCVYNCDSYSTYSAAYPNPARNELIIDRETKNNEVTTNTIVGEQKAKANTATVKVLLYSHSTAKLVYSNDFSASAEQIRIDTSKLPNGVYYLNMISNNEKIKEQTIIINH
jgi:subtilisin family serine protease